jgi:hypothetical protein
MQQQGKRCCLVAPLTAQTIIDNKHATLHYQYMNVAGEVYVIVCMLQALRDVSCMLQASFT